MLDQGPQLQRLAMSPGIIEIEPREGWPEFFQQRHELAAQAMRIMSPMSFVVRAGSTATSKSRPFSVNSQR